jgi:hypothetical protein
MASARVPLEGVCLSRDTPVEHVRALVAAGVLAVPTVDRAGREMVPACYMDAIEDDPVPTLPDGEWRHHCERELRRFLDGRTRLLTAVGPERGRRREQQLMRIASAAWGIGLPLLMQGERAVARIWLRRAATLYRRSLADAEPGSWGRSIGAIKSRLLADDRRGAECEAAWTLQLGALDASTIGRYAGCLALLTLGRDEEARSVARDLGGRDHFPEATAACLMALAEGDSTGYASAVRAVLKTFETRSRFLEDIPVADTVLVLQELAAPRRLAIEVRSDRLPADAYTKDALETLELG